MLPTHGSESIKTPNSSHALLYPSLDNSESASVEANNNNDSSHNPTLIQSLGDTTSHFYSTGKTPHFHENDQLSSLSHSSSASKKVATPFVAMLHIICITAGVGVLNLPKVVADGGWLTICFFPVMSCIADYTSRLIIKCLYLAPQALRNSADPLASPSSYQLQMDLKNNINNIPMNNPDATLLNEKMMGTPNDDMERANRLLNRPRVDGLHEVGEAAFGKAGLYLVHIFHKIVLFGICVVFLVLAGACVQQLFEPLLNLYEWQWILIITAIIAVPVVFLKSMKEVIWTSAVGFSATIFLVIVTVILCIVELQQANTAKAVPINHEIFIWSHLPLSLAGITFAYCGNYVYPSIEETMAKPQLFGRTISFSMTFITLLYIPVAVLAYLAYGDTVQSPILKSFPNNGWVIALLVFIAGHVLATLPLPLVALILEAEKRLGLGDPSQPEEEEALHQTSLAKKIIRLNAGALLRLAFLGCISLIACLFYRSFTDIMDFFGAIANSSFLFFFPIIFHIKLKGWRNISKGELIIDALILLFGVLTTIVGGYQAAVNLCKSFSIPFS